MGDLWRRVSHENRLVYTGNAFNGETVQSLENWPTQYHKHKTTMFDGTIYFTLSSTFCATARTLVAIETANWVRVSGGSLLELEALKLAATHLS